MNDLGRASARPRLCCVKGTLTGEKRMATKDDNIAPAKQAAFEHIAEIGKTEGQGAVARVTLAE